MHAPCLYVHLQRNRCFLGAGMWRPDAPSLAAVRRAIDEDGAAWKKVRDRRSLRDAWNFTGDSLKRPPRGFAVDHPFVEDLRRTDFLVVADLSHDAVVDPDFPKHCAREFAKVKEFLGYLAEAIGVEF